MDHGIGVDATPQCSHSCTNPTDYSVPTTVTPPSNTAPHSWIHSSNCTAPSSSLSSSSQSYCPSIKSISRWNSGNSVLDHFDRFEVEWWEAERRGRSADKRVLVKI